MVVWRPIAASDRASTPNISSPNTHTRDYELSTFRLFPSSVPLVPDLEDKAGIHIVHVCMHPYMLVLYIVPLP